jgi:hypothetical protein
VQYSKIKLNFLLIQPPCHISKRLYGESKPCDYLYSAPSYKCMTNILQPGRCDMKVRNNNIIHAFEDLLLLALENVPETSQMVLLFDKLLPYIPKMSIYLACLIQKNTGSNSPNMTKNDFKSYL